MVWCIDRFGITVRSISDVFLSVCSLCIVEMNSQKGATSVFLTSAAVVAFTSAVGYLCYQRGKQASACRRKHTKEDRSRGHVGPRGLDALSPPIPYLDKFLKCLDDPCDPDTNRRAYIALCVAENKLVLDLLAERCVLSSANAFADRAVYLYNNFLGMPVAREAAAYFLARRFLFPHRAQLTPDEALRHVQPKHVAFGAGCAAMLNHLFFLLGNDNGDCCLIPKPYYAAFENDMNLVAGIIPYGVSQAQPMRGPTVEEWQAAYDAAKREGLSPKFLLLTSPNNPLGVVYSETFLKETVDWARARDMHTIVDEIYALSTQPPHEFHSILRVLNNDLRDDVHFLWAISKDFGASGLRCGLVYTKNEVLLEGMGSSSVFTCVSGPIQYLVAELLTDDTYVNEFLAASQHRLAQSYEICKRKLDEMVLPFVPAQAGLFVYVDFSTLLPEKTFEYEAKLTDLMFRYARVVLTPGEAQRDDSPGNFRICYAWVEPSVLEIGMERLSRFVAKLRRLNWNDLGDRAFASVLDA